MRHCLGILMFLAACVSSSCARPESPSSQNVRHALPAASAPIALEPGQLLRQLSLDLLGRPPRVEEMDALLAAGEIGNDRVEQMLTTDEFLDQVEGWHAELLWPNISRYRPGPVPLFAAPLPPKDPNRPRPPEHLRPYTDIGWYWVGGQDISPDPALIDDAKARADHVVAIATEAFRSPLRGSYHAYPDGLCDLSPEAEYPDPSVVGTAQNWYTVPSARSGNGRAYSASYYSETPGVRGAVMPIRDFLHCPNFCRRQDCNARTSHDVRENIGPFAGCFRSMETPGDDPSGRHELDTPGMRCPDGYVREINQCDFQKVGWEETNTAFTIDNLDIPFRVPGRPALHLDGAKTVFGKQVEGWRWFEHYWSKGQKLRTCALETQEREYGLYQKYPNGKPIECAKALSLGYFIQDSTCGCGPKGAYCGPVVTRNQETESRTGFRLRRAIEREPLRIIRSVVDSNEDYGAILTTKRSFINGPLAFAWRYQGPILRGEGFSSVSPPDRGNPVWETVPFESEAWALYERPPRHSGILTTLAYLQRFPTYRARVAQYRRAFLCSTEFDYAPQPDPGDTNPDIAARKGCSSCHTRLENDGMYFGRYPDRTPVFVDASAMPKSDKFFEQIFKYRSPAAFDRLDEGPEAMVRRDLAEGAAFNRCTVDRAWRRLVRREPTADELAEMLQQFETNHRSFRALVRAIVTHRAYREVQP